MEPLKIAICDDEETALTIIESAVKATFTRERVPVELTACTNIISPDTILEVLGGLWLSSLHTVVQFTVCHSGAQTTLQHQTWQK